MNEKLILKLYAIKDELNGYAPPITLPNDYVAKRYFKDMCTENPTMRNSQADFSIWYIGEYNTASGTITSGNGPTKLT